MEERERGKREGVMSFNGMTGKVSKTNRMPQQACTEPIQKKGRNSRRAREENPGLCPKRSEMWASMCPS